MYEKTFTVSDQQSAKQLGSGDLEVLATPALIAMLENCAKESMHELLKPGQSSVGTQIELSHLQPTAIGAKIACRVQIIDQQPKLVRFTLQAYQDEQKIAEGTHTRAIIEIERFLNRLKEQNLS